MVVGLDQYCNKYCLYLFLVGNKIYLARDPEINSSWLEYVSNMGISIIFLYDFWFYFIIPRIHYFVYRVIYCTAHNISFRSILLHSNQYPRYICRRLVLGHILLAVMINKVNKGWIHRFLVHNNIPFGLGSMSLYKHTLSKHRPLDTLRLSVCL